MVGKITTMAEAMELINDDEVMEQALEDLKDLDAHAETWPMVYALFEKMFVDEITRLQDQGEDDSEDLKIISEFLTPVNEFNAERLRKLITALYSWFIK